MTISATLYLLVVSIVGLASAQEKKDIELSWMPPPGPPGGMPMMGNPFYGFNRGLAYGYVFSSHILIGLFIYYCSVGVGDARDC